MYIYIQRKFLKTQKMIHKEILEVLGGVFLKYVFYFLKNKISKKFKFKKNES